MTDQTIQKKLAKYISHLLEADIDYFMEEADGASVYWNEEPLDENQMAKDLLEFIDRIKDEQTKQRR